MSECGKLAQYRINQVGNWCPRELQGHLRVAVSVKICETSYYTFNQKFLGDGWTVRV